MQVYLGVDVGGTKIAAGLVDLSGKVLERQEVPTESWLGAKQVKLKILDIMKRMLEIDRYKVLAAGVGFPGIINHHTGETEQAANIKDWGKEKLGVIMQQAFPLLPVYFANDANAAALGELYFGAGKGFHDVCYITVSTGIGSGFISGGKLIVGKNGGAGEIGHMIIQPDGPLCGCGSRGCLEAFASGTALALRAKQRLATGETSILHKKQHISAIEVFAAADAGDELAQACVAEQNKYLGMGIVNVVNLFNPELVIVGGGVSKRGEKLLDPIRKYCSQHAFACNKHTPIVQAQLKGDVGIVGAAAVAISGKRDGR
ncbi:MAG: ROK family protein [Clostridia bacterium]